ACRQRWRCAAQRAVDRRVDQRRPAGAVRGEQVGRVVAHQCAAPRARGAADAGAGAAHGVRRHRPRARARRPEGQPRRDRRARSRRSRGRTRRGAGRRAYPAGQARAHRDQAELSATGGVMREPIATTRSNTVMSAASATDTIAAAPAARPASPWPVFWVASVATFLVSLDGTMLYSVFGSLRAAFPAASAADMSWVLNAYTVV